MIEIQKKKWLNDSVPYLDEDMLNNNEQALVAVVDVCVDLEGQLND